MTKYYYHENLMHHMALMNQDRTIDRSGTFPHHEDMALITPIGRVVAQRDIGEIMHERAAELVAIARAQCKPIYLFWSGGIDSTAAFFALRDHVNKDELVVICNETSESEYPGFIKQNIAGVYQTAPISMDSTWKSVQEACTKGIAVTGEIGDQLMGSIKYLDYTAYDLKRNWKDVVRLKNRTFVDQLLPFIEACPQEIESLAAMYWWTNYAMKYQLVQVRMMRDNTESILGENLFHFFDSASFNDWAVSTPIEEKIPDFDQLKYKMPLRQFILNSNGDRDYFTRKGKVRSLTPNYGRTSRVLLASAITTDFQREYP